MESRKVVNILHDGFPLESWPPQGFVTLVFENGTSETLPELMTIKKYEKMVEDYGLVFDYEKNYKPEQHL